MMSDKSPDKTVKRKRKARKEKIPDFGGLEYDIPDEVILKDIADYPYVMGKLKDC
ncbi:hypothetical protein [Methanomethylophilus alvi]|uniref:hypothetical protein n=1 Tax=Methanomethylophilus alvi TaxID=1291540 RepID=UPI0037DC9EBF